MNEQLAEPLEHVLGVQLSFYIDRQALPRVLVDDRQQPVRATLVSAVMHEVVRPDVILVLRPMPDAAIFAAT